ncbi:twin-arginine translocation pathway signal protein [Parafrankia colletiae]|uniref:Twin-arginine translocation pathway signal protein n=1 Tax=Parafrankia colletiae TaxID=573497 RepID=A0A1S1QXY6_9ACTN|nr:FAD-binding oxidoreductase [Parafrankia colletiae]MCK9898849.1 FAD-binding oxidoreductase [Frankia sp. Cpl3]OHV38341.1 twin-arginine translocation pathway signal protein [Parafrankia colletiae]
MVDGHGSVDRREALRLAGAGLALLGLGGFAAGVTGCGGAGEEKPTERDWQRLAEKLSGRLVRPGTQDYATASQLFDPAFDQIRPQGIAYCASAADVAASLAFARSAGIPLAARSGGHSYGGYSASTGLVIDVSLLNEVRPGSRSGAGGPTADGPAADGTAAAGIAAIGAGAQLVDVYDQLAQAGAALAAGSCPTVGVAGLTLGGGIGVASRRHGLTCDQLLSAEVVLASGEIIRVDGERDADLFWALRGGGGGNFGVVTSFTFATYQAVPLTIFTYRWPWDAAADVIAAWQDWNLRPDAPDDLWSTCVLTSTTSTGGAAATVPVIRVSGVISDVAPATGSGPGARTPLGGSSGSSGSAGSATAVPRTAQDLLAQLVDAVGRAPSSTFAAQRGPLEAMLIEAGCAGRTVAQCHLTGRRPEGTLPRVAQLAASNFLTEPLSGAGAEALLDAVEARQQVPGLRSGGVVLDSWGGAIGRLGPQETAFVHRDVVASAQYIAGYDLGDDGDLRARNAGWLRDTVAALAPHVSPSAYQNYIDPQLTDWETAYYGANLPRLRSVKRAYDPDNVFAFAQSIRPA